MTHFLLISEKARKCNATNARFLKRFLSYQELSFRYSTFFKCILVFFMLFLTRAELLCVTSVQRLFHLVEYIILLYLDESISFIDYSCIGSCYFNAI